jgi:hypothetical protein
LKWGNGDFVIRIKRFTLNEFIKKEGVKDITPYRRPHPNDQMTQMTQTTQSILKYEFDKQVTEIEEIEKDLLSHKN